MRDWLGLAYDIIKAPIMAVKDSKLVIQRRVIVHKINSGLKQRDNGKTNFQSIKDKYFRTMVEQLGKAWH